MARVSMILLQIMYLVTYGFAIYFLEDSVRASTDLTREVIPREPLRALQIASSLTTLLMVIGCWGIALRLYLIASIGFDDSASGIQFRRLFPFIFVIDEIWALTPLLLYHKWRLGLTILCMAILAYVPITQRNLVRSAYPGKSSGSSDRVKLPSRY